MTQIIGKIEQLTQPARPLEVAINALRDGAANIARDQAGDVLTQRLARIDDLEELAKQQQARIAQYESDIDTFGAENDRLSKLVQTDESLQRRSAQLDKRESELNAKMAQIEADTRVRDAEKARDIAVAEKIATLNVVGLFTRNPSWVQTVNGNLPLALPGFSPPAGSGGTSAVRLRPWVACLAGQADVRHR